MRKLGACNLDVGSFGLCGIVLLTYLVPCMVWSFIMFPHRLLAMRELWTKP